MITAIVGIIGLLAALFFKNKADNAGVAATLANTKGKDEVLLTEQELAVKAQQDLDAGIEKMKADREVQRQVNENMSLAERAAALKKGLS